MYDIGIYALSWDLLALDSNIGEQAKKPTVVASQALSDGIDVASVIVLSYETGAQAVLTSSTSFKTAHEFCRIEGPEGYIVVQGQAASTPDSFIVYLKADVSTPEGTMQSKKYEFEKPGRGFYWEADAVAMDIAMGKLENDTMPWAETLRVLGILDEVRRQGGAKFPQDAA